MRKIVPMGCDRKSIFDTSFHAYGLSSMVRFLVMVCCRDRVLSPDQSCDSLEKVFE